MSSSPNYRTTLARLGQTSWLTNRLHSPQDGNPSTGFSLPTCLYTRSVIVIRLMRCAVMNVTVTFAIVLLLQVSLLAVQRSYIRRMIRLYALWLLCQSLELGRMSWVVLSGFACLITCPTQRQQYCQPPKCCHRMVDLTFVTLGVANGRKG